jgi:hypothetical protein
MGMIYRRASECTLGINHDKVIIMAKTGPAEKTEELR